MGKGSGDAVADFCKAISWTLKEVYGCELVRIDVRMDGEPYVFTRSVENGETPTEVESPGLLRPQAW